MSLTSIEACGLRKSYGAIVAADGVSFAVTAGEIFGLLGPNGAGKTTTILMLAGLLRPDAGQVHIDGRPVRRGDRAMRTQVGWVPQHVAIYRDLSIRENLFFFGRLYGLGGASLRDRVDAVLDLSGMRDRADRLAGRLSAGEQRRVSLAVGLVHEPRILILDEATAGLDPHSRRQILEQVRELAGGGVAVIFASHYMDEVQALCGRVALLDRGLIVECGSVTELLARNPGTVEVELEGPAPELPPTLAGLAVLKPGAGTRTCIVLSRDGARSAAALTAELLRALEQSGRTVTSVHFRDPSLEDLFLRLTGRTLRE